MVNTQEVLHKVNAARVACGALPLRDIARGQSGNSRQCPLANSLKEVFPSVGVGSSVITGVPRNRAGAVASAIGGSVRNINGLAEINAPAEFSQFVNAFDAGRLPQYRK